MVRSLVYVLSSVSSFVPRARFFCATSVLARTSCRPRRSPSRSSCPSASVPPSALAVTPSDRTYASFRPHTVGTAHNAYTVIRAYTNLCAHAPLHTRTFAHTLAALTPDSYLHNLVLKLLAPFTLPQTILLWIRRERICCTSPRESNTERYRAICGILCARD